MKRTFYIIYSIVLIGIGVALAFDASVSTQLNFFYFLNIQLLLFFGIERLFPAKKKKVIVLHHQLIVRAGNTELEKLDLRKVLKLSPQHNRVTLFFEGYVKHLVYKDFNSSSQKLIKALTKSY